MKIFIWTLICFGILSGCITYEEIQNEEIPSAFIINSSPSFKGYLYKGSDIEFHYFVSKWDIQKDKYFKMPTMKLDIINRLQFPKNGIELKVDLFQDGNGEFGRNEFYTLYIIK